MIRLGAVLFLLLGACDIEPSSKVAVTKQAVVAVADTRHQALIDRGDTEPLQKRPLDRMLAEDVKGRRALRRAALAAIASVKAKHAATPVANWPSTSRAELHYWLQTLRGNRMASHVGGNLRSPRLPPTLQQERRYLDLHVTVAGSLQTSATRRMLAKRKREELGR